MIHHLVVTADMPVKDTQKLARKLAMTGGYEVCLGEELSAEELSELFTVWKEELLKYPKDSAARSASIAGRVLQLAARHPNAPSDLRGFAEE